MQIGIQVSNRAIKSAILYWLLDAVAAIGFALGLALLIGGGLHNPAKPALLALMFAAAVARGFVAVQAVQLGLRGASEVKRNARTQILSPVLASAPQRGRLRGEDSYTLLDAIEALEGYAANYRPLRFAAMLTPCIVIAAVSVASWVAAAILLATLVPFALGMALAGMAARDETRRQQAALERMGSLFADRIRNLPLIYAYAHDDRLVRHLHASAREFADKTLQVLRVAFVSSAVLEFFAALAVALVAAYCGFSLLALLPFAAPEQLRLTEAMFALALAPEVYLGMRRLAVAYHDKQQGESALEHLDRQHSEAVRLAPEPMAISGALPLSICLDEVVIRFADGTIIGPVTHQFNGAGLHVIAGPSGSGKSSLLAAMVDMAPLSEGTIKVDGVPLADAALSCGWAGQRTLLLPGLLRDSILPSGAADDFEGAEELLDALRLSPLLAKRGGLAMQIDARGSGLSGGERRRIGLARALLSKRPLLLLDEPTADLDADSAAAVLAVIDSYAKAHMIIAATHDNAVFEKAKSGLVLL